jgi:hypothetical protein
MSFAGGPEINVSEVTHPEGLHLHGRMRYNIDVVSEANASANRAQVATVVFPANGAHGRKAKRSALRLAYRVTT